MLLEIEGLPFVLLHLLRALWQVFDSDLDHHFSTLMARLREELLKSRLLAFAHKCSLEPFIDVLINRLQSFERHFLVIILSSHHLYNDYASSSSAGLI